MKALNTDAVRKLYRGKYVPATEEPEINGAPIQGISFRLSLAFAALAAVSDRDTVKLLEAIMHDFDLLRDMEREDSFVKGFRCAAELRLPADRKEK